MRNLCDIEYLKPLLKKHGFTFSKGLGQNFLCDAGIPVKIAENADVDRETCVLEVGPGVGALTQELLLRAKSVTAVELDKRLFPLLAETVGGSGNFSVVEGDILKTDIPGIVRGFSGRKAVACANLPYYITTPAITALIGSRCFETITVMVQREVAERMCASPGGKEYGAFSVYVQYYTKPEIVAQVGRECFIPSPSVDSAVVRMRVRKDPPVDCDEDGFFRLVRAAFAQRRKTLINCLSAYCKADKTQLGDTLERAGLGRSARGEELSIESFALLLKELEKIQ